MPQEHRVISLPTETISEIFDLGTHGNGISDDLISFPLLVSHVSRRWRQIALSTPSLWSTVVMAGMITPNQIDRSIAWLSRSQPCALRIFLDFRDAEWNWDEHDHRFRSTHMKEVLRVILPHLSRWRDVELLTDTWKPVHTFLWHCKDRTGPWLHRLSLSRCNAYLAERGEPFHPSALKTPVRLLSAPLLQEVTLSGVHIDWKSSPLQNLKELNLRYHAQEVMPPLHDFISLLSASPALEKLAIVGWGPKSVTDEWHDGLEGSIHLPHLHQFTFGSIESDYGIRLLSLLATPNLRKLTIEDLANSLDPGSTNDSATILSFFSNHALSFIGVEHLKLSAVRCSAGGFTQFMRTFPRLRTLFIDETDVALLTALTHHSNDGGVINPFLCHVSFRKISSNYAMSFLRARANMRRPVMSAVLEVADPLMIFVNDGDIGSTKFRIIPIQNQSDGHEDFDAICQGVSRI